MLKIQCVGDSEEGGWQISIFCLRGRGLLRSRDCSGESYWQGLLRGRDCRTSPLPDHVGHRNLDLILYLRRVLGPIFCFEYVLFILKQAPQNEFWYGHVPIDQLYLPALNNMKLRKLPMIFIVYKNIPTCINEIKMGLTLAVPMVQLLRWRGRIFLSCGVPVSTSNRILQTILYTKSSTILEFEMYNTMLHSGCKR